MSRTRALPARRMTGLLLAAALIAVAAACTPAPPPPGPTGSGTPTATATAPPTSSSAPPSSSASASGEPQTGGKPGHVFVINLENKGYDKVWGAGSAAPYLSRTLRAQGVLLSEYYGIAHNSNPNYLAQISGQGSNPMTRADCPTYAPFTQTGTADHGQVQGTGCVYPESVPTVAGQLSAAGKTWKGYMEDMGTPCLHPEPGPRPTPRAASRANRTRPVPTPSSTSPRSPPPRTASATSWTSRPWPGTCSPWPRPRTSPTSRPTSAMTATTTPASTAAREGWPPATAGFGSRSRPSSTPPLSSRTACWSSPSTRPRARRPGQPRFREAPPAAASAPWCSHPSPAAARHRTRPTTTSACWPASRTSSRFHGWGTPGRRASRASARTCSTPAPDADVAAPGVHGALRPPAPAVTARRPDSNSVVRTISSIR